MECRPRADIVQEKVTVWMDDFVPESVRHGEDAAVDLGPWSRCRECWHMAHRAADLGEKLLAGAHIGADFPSRWRLRGTHEVCERHDVHLVILRVGHGIAGRAKPDEDAARGVLLGEEWARDTHLV
jgi:hypothetical protein